MQTAEEFSTHACSDAFVHRIHPVGFYISQLSTSCPPVGYMRSYHAGDGKLHSKIVRGELLWTQAITAGTCPHLIAPIRGGDSGSPIYDGSDPDSKIVGAHVGGNEYDDERGLGVFVQASFIIKAALRIGSRRTAEFFHLGLTRVWVRLLLL